MINAKIEIETITASARNQSFEFKRMVSVDPRPPDGIKSLVRRLSLFYAPQSERKMYFFSDDNRYEYVEWLTRIGIESHLLFVSSFYMVLNSEEYAFLMMLK